MKKLFTLLLIIVCFFSISSFANSWNLPGIEIISRAEWWADESIRYLSMSYSDFKELQKKRQEEAMDQLAASDYNKFLEKQKEDWRLEYERMARNDYLSSFFSLEQQINNVVYNNWLSYLSWPQSYNYQKSKIIVHHTADNTSGFTGLESVREYLHKTYKFHAITRWRGDIWYNFLIDPYGNIYEGRAGWAGVIAAHTLRNNTPSVWIALMWNFEIQQPTAKQLVSLVKLISTLSAKYNIDPTATAHYHREIKESPYMKSNQSYTIAGHRDAWATACPGKNLYALLPQIRALVKQALVSGTSLPSISNTNQSTTNTSQTSTSTNISTNTINQTSSNSTISSNPSSTSSSSNARWLNLLKNWRPVFDQISQAFKKEYLKKKKTSLATTFTNKITAKVSLDQVKQYIKSDISVLLHELSMDYKSWDIYCDSICSFQSPSGIYKSDSASIKISNWKLLLSINNQNYLLDKIIVTANAGLIEIKNYPRVSYMNIPWNTFYGSISFEKWPIKNLKTDKYDNQYILVNTLSFHQYLRWIAETNDSEEPEKIKAINLISKMYALFYMHPENIHPSIPASAPYLAVDHPDIFQKYVWAGLEKTLKIVPQFVSAQRNEIILYDGYVPILPYFSCSAGFTWSAKDKWWWQDTPYLVSRVDIDKCSDFSGHWVWLSGKWAQFFAKNSRTYQEILNYYYPGIQIINL